MNEFDRLYEEANNLLDNKVNPEFISANNKEAAKYCYDVSKNYNGKYQFYKVDNNGRLAMVNKNNNKIAYIIRTATNKIGIKPYPTDAKPQEEDNDINLIRTSEINNQIKKIENQNTAESQQSQTPSSEAEATPTDTANEAETAPTDEVKLHNKPIADMIINQNIKNAIENNSKEIQEITLNQDGNAVIKTKESLSNSYTLFEDIRIPQFLMRFIEADEQPTSNVLNYILTQPIQNYLKQKNFEATKLMVTTDNNILAVDSKGQGELISNINNDSASNDKQSEDKEQPQASAIQQELMKAQVASEMITQDDINKIESELKNQTETIKKSITSTVVEQVLSALGISNKILGNGIKLSCDRYTGQIKQNESLISKYKRLNEANPQTDTNQQQAESSNQQQNNTTVTMTKEQYEKLLKDQGMQKNIAIQFLYEQTYTPTNDDKKKLVDFKVTEEISRHIKNAIFNNLKPIETTPIKKKIEDQSILSYTGTKDITIKGEITFADSQQTPMMEFGDSTIKILYPVIVAKKSESKEQIGKTILGNVWSIFSATANGLHQANHGGKDSYSL